jgi:ABC-type multidrug transport system ATPase subunit
VLAALDGCTFAAQPGRLTGFLGPNGAGCSYSRRMTVTVSAMFIPARDPDRVAQA